MSRFGGSEEMPKGDGENNFVHVQCCLDKSNPIVYNILHNDLKEHGPEDPRKYRGNIELVVNEEITHKQKRLKGLHLSPVELVFRAETLWKDKNLSKEQIINGLWRSFPVYNLSDENMGKLVEHMRKSFARKKRVIIPKKLLSLAVLNYVDNYLQKETTSRYIKTKYIKDLSPGRRSYASRTLKELGYIEERGNCWRRTDKVFDEKDFVE